MNLKKIVSRFQLKPTEHRPIQVEGSLSGDALVGEGWLETLQDTVKAVSNGRPYTYDLELAAGRFNLIIVEPAHAITAFEPDPQTALAEDLQRIIEALPVPFRTRVESTFRALWHEGDDVIGLAFRVEPPGRIHIEKRTRTAADYDRLAARQTVEGYAPKHRLFRSRWPILLLGLIVFVAGTFAVYHLSPGIRMERMTAVLSERLDLDGFDGLIEVVDLHSDPYGISFVMTPLPGCAELLAGCAELLAAAAADAPPPSNKAPEPEQLAAARALIEGHIFLELLDDSGAVYLRLPLVVEGFDGLIPILVKTGPVTLADSPHSARLAH